MIPPVALFGVVCGWWLWTSVFVYSVCLCSFVFVYVVLIHQKLNNFIQFSCVCVFLFTFGKSYFLNRPSDENLSLNDEMIVGFAEIVKNLFLYKTIIGITRTKTYPISAFTLRRISAGTAIIAHVT